MIKFGCICVTFYAKFSILLYYFVFKIFKDPPNSHTHPHTHTNFTYK